MTPLAQRIVKQLTLPPKKRSFVDFPNGLLQHISEAHCFETTAVLELVNQLMTDNDKDRGTIKASNGVELRIASARVQDKIRSIADQTAFLPAPVTWIEFAPPDFGNYRDAYLLVDDFYRGKTNTEKWITVFRVQEDGQDFCFSFPVNDDPFKVQVHGRPDEKPTMTPDDEIQVGIFLPLVLCNLAIINTPKIVPQRTHQPHAGLKRNIQKLPGKYELQPWHEVLLHVDVPEGFSEQGGSTLTGAKALHFCRSFLRLRLGRIELVHAHWRGNPALGIAQTRYRVTR